VERGRGTRPFIDDKKKGSLPLEWSKQKLPGLPTHGTKFVWGVLSVRENNMVNQSGVAQGGVLGGKRSIQMVNLNNRRKAAWW